MHEPGVFKLKIISTIQKGDRFYITVDNDFSVNTICIWSLGAQRPLAKKLETSALASGTLMYFVFSNCYGVYNGSTYKKLKCIDILDNEPQSIQSYTLEEGCTEARKLVYDTKHEESTSTLTFLDNLYIRVKDKWKFL